MCFVALIVSITLLAPVHRNPAANAVLTILRSAMSRSSAVLHQTVQHRLRKPAAGGVPSPHPRPPRTAGVSGGRLACPGSRPRATRDTATLATMAETDGPARGPAFLWPSGICTLPCHVTDRILRHLPREPV